MPFSQSPHSVRAAQPPGRVPLHVAIIMDGNGRWAKARGLPRFEGHRNGVEAVRRAVKSAMQRGIRYLTVYSFSSENWRRPPDEVAMLMGLLKLYIRNDLADLDRNGVKVRVIGERDNLSPDIAALIAEAEARTRDNDTLTLTVAFNYGARQEIVEAARRIALDVRDGRLDPSCIDAEVFSSRLDTSGLPDPDLIIRTSGEMRLSNFLLWQCAYAELVFLPILWPDFDDVAFASALDSYAERERRFGGVMTPAQALTAS